MLPIWKDVSYSALRQFSIKGSKLDIDGDGCHTCFGAQLGVFYMRVVLQNRLSTPCPTVGIVHSVTVSGHFFAVAHRPIDQRISHSSPTTAIVAKFSDKHETHNQMIMDDDSSYHMQDIESDDIEPWERSMRRVFDEATRMQQGHDSSSRSRLVLLEHSESRDYCVAMDEGLGSGEDDLLSALSITSVRVDDDSRNSSIYRPTKQISSLLDSTSSTSSSSLNTMRGLGYKRRVRSSLHSRTGSVGSVNALESREEVEDESDMKRQVPRGTTFDGDIRDRGFVFPLERAGKIGDENYKSNALFDSRVEDRLMSSY